MKNTYLCHYGVKGMKWGVHRESSYTNESAKTIVEDYSEKGKKFTDEILLKKNKSLKFLNTSKNILINLFEIF